MVQGLTFGKGPTTNCLLVNLSTFIYCFKKKKKKAQNKTFVDISIYFFSQRVRERMLQSYCFLARFVFPGNAFVSRRVQRVPSLPFSISFFRLGSILKQRRRSEPQADH